jgi:hypothetical protein
MSGDKPPRMSGDKPPTYGAVLHYPPPVADMNIR